MCQLSLGITNNKNLSYELAVSLAFANTVNDHKDGFGLYIPGTDYLFKFYLEPWRTIGFTKEWKGKFLANSPFLLHVRKSSSKLLINDVKYNHPFVSDKLVLAHNGTLELIKGWISATELDSLHFFNALNKKYEETKNLINALKETMEDYYGKFAFIIYDKVEKIFYVVRGNTATLFIDDLIINGELVGKIINTEKDSIIKAKVLLSNMSNYSISFEKDSSTDVDKETIFKLNGVNLEKADEIKENTYPVTKYTGRSIYYNSGRWSEGKWIEDGEYTESTYKDNFNNRTMSEYADSANSAIEKIMDIMEKWLINPSYLEELFFIITGKSMFNCILPDAEKFLSIFQRMESSLVIKKKNLLADWSIYRNFNVDIFKIHNEYGIQFPYLLENDQKKFVNAILAIEAEIKKKNNE